MSSDGTFLLQPDVAVSLGNRGFVFCPCHSKRESRSVTGFHFDFQICLLVQSATDDRISTVSRDLFLMAITLLSLSVFGATKGVSA